jgi:hypothetical protein
MPQAGGVDHDAFFSGDATGTLWSGRASLTAGGLLFFDIDGDRADAFQGVHDSRPWHLMLSTLEVAYRDNGWLRRAAAGRLVIGEGTPVTLDGAVLSVAPLGALAPGVLFGLEGSELFAFAGAPVYFFVRGEQPLRRAIFSGGTTLRVLRMAALTLDYRGVVDGTRDPELAHDYGARLFVGLVDASGEIYARGLDRELARVGAKARVGWEPWRLFASAALNWQPVELDRVSDLGDPYFAVLGPSYPHVAGSVELSKGQGVVLADALLRVGWQGRLVRALHEGPLNRSYGRVFVSVDLVDVVTTGPFVSTIASIHHTRDPFGDRWLALGGAAGWRASWLQLDVGTDYQQFKYTYFRDVDEIEDVRTVYAGCGVRIFGSLFVRGDYTLEIFDRVVHTARVTVSTNLSAGREPG